jgi:hypothetical protein
MGFSPWERWRLAGINPNTIEDAAIFTCLKHNKRSNANANAGGTPNAEYFLQSCGAAKDASQG